MAITLDIPPEIADVLREKSLQPLEQEALEAAAVEWYRQGRLLHSHFARLLGLSRYDADGVLKRHGVCDGLSQGEFEEDVRAAITAGQR